MNIFTRKLPFFVVLLSFLSLGLLYPIHAQQDTQQNTQNQRVVTIPAEQTITENFFIRAGDIVELYGTLNGDLVVAGGEVIIDGTVNGDVLAAGGDVIISGTVSDDVRVAGGQIQINGQVGKNVTGAGGQITVGETAQIGGGLLAAGGNIRIMGPIEGSVIAAAGNISLSSTVGGDVTTYAGSVRTTGSALISGRLLYTSETDLQVANEASISGGLEEIKVPAGITPDEEDLQTGLGALGWLVSLGFTLISFVSALIFGLLVVKLFPNYLIKTTNTIDTNPLKSLLTGLITVFLTFFLFIALLISVVGIPLAFILLMAFLLITYFIKIVIGFWLGSVIRNRVSPSMNLYLSFIIGLILYYLIGLVPIVGWLIMGVLWLLGLGAMLLTKVQVYSLARDKKII